MNQFLVLLLLSVVALSQQREIPPRAVPYRLVPRGRIEGGQETTPHKWRWQGWITSASGTTVNCGCVLVDPAWIITAAHCVNGISGTSATFGDHNTEIDEGTEVVKEITSSQIIVSGNYGGPDNQYDIALISLGADTVPETDEITYANLTQSIPAAGTNATLTGWGRIEKNGELSPVLKEAVSPIVEPTRCNFYSNINEAERYFICLEHPDNASCNGDSGGPLNYQEEVGGEWRVGGVSSFGSSSTCAGLPKGYTSTNKHACWLENNNGGAFAAYPVEGFENC